MSLLTVVLAGAGLALQDWLRLGWIKVRDSVGGRIVVRHGLEFPTGEHEDPLAAAAMGVALLDKLLAA